jgi:hypothetical protein
MLFVFPSSKLIWDSLLLDLLDFLESQLLAEISSCKTLINLRSCTSSLQAKGTHKNLELFRSQCFEGVLV